jgi:hypothetical protein
MRFCVQSRPGTCNVELEVLEKKWYAFNANTQVGIDGAVTATLRGKLRNLTGNCEHHSLTFGHGRPTLQDQETDMAYKLRFPRVAGKPWHWQTSVHQLYQNCQADSSYIERLRGINFDLMQCDPTLPCSGCDLQLAPVPTHAPGSQATVTRHKKSRQRSSCTVAKLICWQLTSSCLPSGV